MMVDQDNKKYKEVYTEIKIANPGEQHNAFSVCVFNIDMVVYIAKESQIVQELVVRATQIVATLLLHHHRIHIFACHFI